MRALWIALVVALAAAGLCACAAIQPAAKAPPFPYTRLYVFGDSYSDIGFGYRDGNGPTSVAYMADSLSLPLSHTKLADWKGKSLDFAFSGAGTGAGGSRTAQTGYGMIKQGQEFAALVTSGDVVFDPDHTLFFIAGGLNDSRLTTEATEANLTQLVTLMKATGARHFRIAIMPEKLPAFSAVGIRLNPMLAALPAKLTADLGVDAKSSRWGAFYDEVMINAAALGFTNTTDRCSGREIFGELDPPCGDPNAHYYYHVGHPSTAVHKLVGARLYAEITADP